MLLLFVAPQPAIAQAGYINLAEAVSDMWAPLNARSAADAIFWKEADLYISIDEALERLASRAGVFVEYDQSLTTALSTGDYNLPASHIRTIQADLNGKVLRARNVPELEALDSQWPTATAAEPKAFMLDTKGLQRLTLYPAPSAPFASLAIGLTMIKLPTTVSIANAILSAPPALQEYFTYSAIADARSKESPASMDEVTDWLRGVTDLILQAAEGLWS
jgi:hypothetical protein